MRAPVRGAATALLFAALALTHVAAAALVACKGDSEAWGAGYGACSTYGTGKENHKYAMHACARAPFCAPRLSLEDKHTRTRPRAPAFAPSRAPRAATWTKRRAQAHAHARPSALPTCHGQSATPC